MRTTLTGPDGAYTLDMTGTIAGDWVVLSHSRHHINEYYDNVPVFDNHWGEDPLAVQLSVDETSAITGIDFSLDPGFMLSGRVTDTDGNPMELVAIYVETPDGTYANSHMTDADGNWAVGVPDGTYKVYTVNANSYGYINEWWDNLTYSDHTRDQADSIVMGGADRAGIDFQLEVASPTPEVTLPDSAGPFGQGSIVPVAWDVASPTSEGMFHVYAFGNDTYYYLTSQAASGLDSYSYSWTVSQPLGEGYVIRIWYVDGDGNWRFFDDSDVPFEIGI
jgi:hypothetical protein